MRSFDIFLPLIDAGIVSRFGIWSWSQSGLDSAQIEVNAVYSDDGLLNDMPFKTASGSGPLDLPPGTPFAPADSTDPSIYFRVTLSYRDLGTHLSNDSTSFLWSQWSPNAQRHLP
jgi:hypothetical protein